MIVPSLIHSWTIHAAVIYMEHYRTYRIKKKKEKSIKLPTFYRIIINTVITAVSLYPLLFNHGPFTLLLCAWSIIALVEY